MVSKRVKQITKKSKKRRFSGNRWTKLREQAENSSTSEQQNEHVVDNNAETVTAESQEPNEIETPLTPDKKTVSESKVINIQVATPSKQELPVTGNRIIDMDILSNVISTLSCPDCDASSLKLFESYKDKKGLASLLKITCLCGVEKQFYSSKDHNKNGGTGT